MSHTAAGRASLHHTRASFSARVPAHGSQCSHSSSLHRHNCLKSFLICRRCVAMETGHNWCAWNVTSGKCNRTRTHSHMGTCTLLIQHFLNLLWDTAYCYGNVDVWKEGAYDGLRTLYYFQIVNWNRGKFPITTNENSQQNNNEGNVYGVFVRSAISNLVKMIISAKNK